MTTLTNFEKIGLAYDDLQNGLDITALPTLTEHEAMGVARHYRILAGQNDESVWFSDDGNGSILTANPMITKGSQITVRLEKSIEGQAPYAFSECDCLISVLQQGETVTRMQVLMVNLGSCALEDRKGLFKTKQVVVPFNDFDGKTLEIQLAIFANTVQFFKTEEDYQASQDTEFPMATTSFVPSGLFVEGDTPSAPVGFGSGVVKDSGTAPSCFGGPDFHCAVVDGIGGDYAVVWSPFQGDAAQRDTILQYDGMLIAQWTRILDLEKNTGPV